MSGILLAARHAYRAGGLPSIGSAYMGGYYAGIIDTTKGNIIASDASSVGLRYALIVSPKSLEADSKAIGPSGGSPAAAKTRWDGLGATSAMNTATYPAAYYCAGLSYPGDGASAWYLPAMDEMCLIYWSLKCSSESNYMTDDTSSSFPGGTVVQGVNPSSDPTKAAYTSSVPSQTGVSAFKSGGAQALGTSGSSIGVWTATQYGGSETWAHLVSGGAAGAQYPYSDTTGLPVRPVRRLVLS